MEWVKSLQIRNWGLLLKVVAKHMTIKTSGVSSRLVGTSLHITLLDYDSVISDSRLKEELEWLQRMFKIGNFIVLKSSEFGRHAICLDVLKASEVLDILQTSNCDQVFKTAPLINPFRCWVLRYSAKGTKESPMYLYTVESPYEGEHLQSLAHANFLFENYGVTVKLQRPFGPIVAETQTYCTKQKLE